MKLLVVDLETSVKNTLGNHKGSPYCPDNKIVLAGVKPEGKGEYIYNCVPPVPQREGQIVVGHNLKFDLAYLRKENPAWWDYVLSTRVWDTMVAEYLLTAQQHRYASLDECSLRYGGTLKDDGIAKMWDAGVQTEDIPVEMLTEYLKNDLRNTELVALAQIKEAKRLGMFTLCSAMMQVLITTSEMEWNGLHVDRDRLKTIGLQLDAERQSILSQMSSFVAKKLDNISDKDINFSSGKHLSALIFGGEIDYERQELIGKFKTGARAGQDKYKKVLHTVSVNLCEVPKELGTLTKNGWYSTADEELQALADKHEFIKLLIRLRWLNKQYSTYVEGLSSLIFPDGLVHHNLNMVATVTGRLSGTNPNLQNIPSQEESEIKSYFDSRYPDGYVVSADYSQLEVVWQAYLANDKQMKRDIIHGVDFHCKRLALKTGESYDSIVHKSKVLKDPEYVLARKKIKTFSFQRSYGAGAETISAATGMSVQEVKEIIKLEEKTYPGLTQYYNKVKAEVERSTVRGKYKTEAGVDAGVGFFKSCTGRVYHFIQRDAPEFLKRDGILVSYSPTVIKNYPVQGGATGDLVPVMMAELHQRLLRIPGYGNHFVLINQVHDSIMLDVSADYLEDVILITKRTLEDAPYVMNKLFNLNIDIPFKVDIEYGRNWKYKTN